MVIRVKKNRPQDIPLKYTIYVTFVAYFKEHECPLNVHECSLIFIYDHSWSFVVIHVKKIALKTLMKVKYTIAEN